jgi:foldase protein PrsA
MARRTGLKNRFQPRKFLPALKKSWEKNRSRYVVAIIIIVAAALLTSLVVWRKSWFVVAMVNNRPVTSIELYQRLNQRYGKSTLDGLIEEKLIYQEAAKQEVAVSTKEIDDRLAEIEKQLGGKEALDYALKSQGYTLEQVKDQIKTQLIVEKILGKDIKVSDADVESYIKDNPAAKDLSKDEVRTQILRQKVNEKASSWLDDLKKKAKIVKFI